MCNKQSEDGPILISPQYYLQKHLRITRSNYMYARLRVVAFAHTCDMAMCDYDWVEERNRQL